MRNQKGFSLVELIVAIAIMAVVGGAVVGFCLSGTNSYKNVSNEIDLQYEAQLVINQLEDLLVDSSKGIGYDSATNTLSIYNNEEAYDVVWNSTDSVVDLNRYAKVGTDMVMQSSNLMAEYVTDFSVIIPTEDKNKNQTVNLSMKFEKADKEYLVTKNITLRNKTALFDKMDDAYPDASIVNWTITSLDIYKAGDDPADPAVLATDMTDVARGSVIQFSAQVNGTNNPPQDVTWSLSSSGNIKHSDSTTLVNGVLTIANEEPTGELVVTASSNYKPSVTSSIIVKLEEKTIEFKDVTITRKSTSESAPAEDSDAEEELGAIEGDGSILAGHYADFTALVSGVGLLGDQETRVIWSLEAPEGKVLTTGTAVTADGRVTVALDETCDTITLTATSYYDENCKASKTLSVIKPAYTTVHIYSDASMSSSVANQTISDVNIGTSHDLYAYVEGDNLTKEQQAAIIWLVTDKDGNNLATGTTISVAGNVSMTDANTTAANKATLSISSSEVNSEIKVTAKSANSDTVYATVTYKLLIPNYESIAISADGAKYASGSTLGEIKPGVDTISFSAEVIGSNVNTAVIWSVLANEGTMAATSISDSGLLTVGANETASSVKVVAKAAGKTDLTAYVIVPIEQPAPKITLSYNGSDVTNGQFELKRTNGYQTVVIKAVVENATNNKVTWTRSDDSSVSESTETSILIGDKSLGEKTFVVTATKTVGSKSYSASVTIKLTNNNTVGTITIKGANDVPLGRVNEPYNVEYSGNPVESKKGVTWTVLGNESPDTTISSTGKLTVATDETANQITIRAQSIYDVTKIAEKKVNIKRPNVKKITVQFNNKKIKTNDKFYQGNAYELFTAKVEGDNLTDEYKKVTWSIDETDIKEGTYIDENGRLVIAQNEPKDKTITIRATSKSNPSVFGTVEIKVLESKYTKVDITLDGKSVTNELNVVQGATITFGATFTTEGISVPKVEQWTVTGSKAASDAPETKIKNGVLFISPGEKVDTVLTVTAKAGDKTDTIKIKVKQLKINYYLTSNTAQNGTAIQMAGTKNGHSGRYYFAYSVDTANYGNTVDLQFDEKGAVSQDAYGTVNNKLVRCVTSTQESGTGQVLFQVAGYTVETIDVTVHSGNDVEDIDGYTYYVGINYNSYRWIQYDYCYQFYRFDYWIDAYYTSQYSPVSTR